MIFVAGRPLSDDDAFERLHRYPRQTPRRYDLPPCQPGRITAQEIRRTRALASRISEAEGRWFQRRSVSWDWAAIPPEASLAKADPEVEGGLYDQAAHLYGHFFAERPRRVGRAKVSKVLHLKYPALVPILDDRVVGAYRDAARAAARRSPRWSGRFRRLYWAAIRDDLLASDLTELRRRLAQDIDTAPLSELTDLRLLDALTWRD